MSNGCARGEIQNIFYEAGCANAICHHGGDHKTVTSICADRSLSFKGAERRFVIRGQSFGKKLTVTVVNIFNGNQPHIDFIGRFIGS